MNKLTRGDVVSARSASGSRRLRVVIDAQLISGGSNGGVEQFMVGLVHGLGRLGDGDEEYVVLTSPQDPAWLEPYLGANQRTVVGPDPQGGVAEQAKKLLGPLRGPAARLWRVLHGRSADAVAPVVRESDGFYEALDADVLHFPHQGYVRSRVPTVYNPHDLQHLHYPEFFTPEQIAGRETTYPAGCRESRAVATESEAVKRDVAQRYGVDPAKVHVVRRGSPMDVYEASGCQSVSDVRTKFGLPSLFALYPAQSWPHKNHLRLVEALKVAIEKHNLALDLVFTGTKNNFWPVIEQRIRELGLERRVFALGYVPVEEVRALYEAAQFVVFPSLFEGLGLPLVEAFRERAPVACASLGPLREYGGDAALYFDPMSVDDIVRAMLRMTSDDGLRATLKERGRARARLLSWDQTARCYRAIYREVAGSRLSSEDHRLLEVDPLGDE